MAARKQAALLLEGQGGGALLQLKVTTPTSFRKGKGREGEEVEQQQGPGPADGQQFPHPPPPHPPPHLHKLPLIMYGWLVVSRMTPEHALAPIASQAALGNVPVHTMAILEAISPAASVNRAIRVPAVAARQAAS